MSPASNLVGAVREIAERAGKVARLEVELKKLEVRKRVVTLGLGSGLAAAAALLLLFMVGFALAALAAGIAEWLPVWAALLIVSGALLLVAGALAVAAREVLRRGRPAGGLERNGSTDGS